MYQEPSGWFVWFKLSCGYVFTIGPPIENPNLENPTWVYKDKNGFPQNKCFLKSILFFSLLCLYNSSLLVISVWILAHSSLERLQTREFLHTSLFLLNKDTYSLIILSLIHANVDLKIFKWSWWSCWKQLSLSFIKSEQGFPILNDASIYTAIKISTVSRCNIFGHVCWWWSL